MNTNKVVILGSIITIILLISIPTVYKVIKNHNDHLYKATYDKILNSAKNCFYDQNCPEEIITLKTLYEKNYLKPVSNPITKEYYNENSYVKRVNTTFQFYEVE